MEVPGYVTRSVRDMRKAALLASFAVQDLSLTTEQLDRLVRYLSDHAVGWHVWHDACGGIHTKRADLA
jgi:hypothetical protein